MVSSKWFKEFTVINFGINKSICEKTSNLEIIFVFSKVVKFPVK